MVTVTLSRERWTCTVVLLLEATHRLHAEGAPDLSAEVRDGILPALLPAVTPEAAAELRHALADLAVHA
jgi:hypothetical protein